MNKIVLSVIITALLAGGLGFFGGMQYQKSRKLNFQGQFPNGERAGNGTVARQNTDQVRNFQGNRPVSGEVVSFDDNTLTVKTQDGNKIVIYSESTKVNKTSEGTKEDLKTGEQVMVIGTEGSDGTVTAQSISIGGNFFQGVIEQPTQSN